jgi:acyl-CoA thioester hydrolase
MIEAPLHLYHDTVRPQWIDYNGHMTEGYYAVVFGNASDAFIDFARMDAAYRAQTNGTIYTGETHLCFLREVKEATPLHFTTQLLSCDGKRMHVFHQMWAYAIDHAEEGYLAATFETMMLHVNQDSGRVSPFPDDIRAWLEQIQIAHASLPRPEQVGRAIQRL